MIDPEQAVRDYVEWHGEYDVPGSTLAKRLAMVRRRSAQALDAIATTEVAVLSLCAGDGRDILDVLERRPRRPGQLTTLVEINPTLATRAQEEAQRRRLSNVSVVMGDAALTSTWESCLPVDLLMLCGIFGNISTDDVWRTLRAVPAVVRPGGYLVWTRCHSDGEDRRPEVRRWCTELGLLEVEFDGHPETFGVGLNQRSADVSSEPLPERLFTFLR